MSDTDAELDKQMAKLHQECATHNAEVAVKTAKDTREELLQRLDRLDGLVAELSFKVVHLHDKYNLLLSERFNTGPTEPDDCREDSQEKA
jgi:hypothetical protein